MARVVLSGGVLQNRVLRELLSDAIAARGCEALVHRQVPASDGGLSLGQVASAAATLRAGPA